MTKERVHRISSSIPMSSSASRGQRRQRKRLAASAVSHEPLHGRGSQLLHLRALHGGQAVDLVRRHRHHLLEQRCARHAGHRASQQHNSRTNILCTTEQTLPIEGALGLCATV